MIPLAIRAIEGDKSCPCSSTCSREFDRGGRGGGCGLEARSERGGGVAEVQRDRDGREMVGEC